MKGSSGVIQPPSAQHRLLAVESFMYSESCKIRRSVLRSVLIIHFDFTAIVTENALKPIVKFIIYNNHYSVNM